MHCFQYCIVRTHDGCVAEIPRCRDDRGMPRSSQRRRGFGSTTTASWYIICWFVTDFLFGVDKKRKWKETACLIHGSNHSSKGKEPHTGIKHMVTNRVLLASQKDYFDVHPRVMIIPILSRQDAINWTGGAYDAIMMIDQFPPKPTEADQHTLSSVCIATQFLFDGPTATTADVKLATCLLQDYTKAILFAQREKSQRKPGLSWKIPQERTTQSSPMTLLISRFEE